MQTADIGPLRVSRLALGTMLMGGAHAGRRGRADARHVPRGGRQPASTPPTPTATAPRRRRSRRGSRAGATRSSWPRRCASRSPTPAVPGLDPDRIRARLRRQPAPPGHRRHRPLPGPRARPRRAARATRSRRSTASSGRARSARWAPRTSRPGCWPGRSRVQDREGWAPFVSLQPQYSLVERSVEVEVLPFCRAAGLGVLPWGPLGAGFLTGRYRRDERPRRGRAWPTRTTSLEEAPARRAIERNFRAVDEARAIAAGPRRDGGPGRAGLAPGPARRHLADHRAAHAGPARGPAARRRAGARRRRARAPRASHAPPDAYPQRFLLEQNGIDVERQPLAR